MKKSDLRTGMRVEQRNGEISIVLLGLDSGDRIVGNHGRDALEYYDDDFKYVRGIEHYDIVKIYDAPKKITDIFNFNSKGELLWQRTEVKEITFASWKEMAKFLIDRELYTIRGRRYFSNSSSLELRFYVQYPSGKPQELTNGWLDYNQTFYLSDPTKKPEIVMTYNEAKKIIAEVKKVDVKQVKIVL